MWPNAVASFGRVKKYSRYCHNNCDKLCAITKDSCLASSDIVLEQYVGYCCSLSRQGAQCRMNSVESSKSIKPLRDGQVETMRGLACLLLVAFHVIGPPGYGMHVVEGSIWRDLANLFTPVRMPLFAFISGLVFVTATGPSSRLVESLFKKYRRLGIPLVTVSLTFDVAYMLIGDSRAEYSPYKLFFTPFLHFWFLQSALLIATFVTVGMLVFTVNRSIFATGLFCFSLIATFFVPELETDYFSILGAVYLLPFFSLGLMLRVLDGQVFFRRPGLHFVTVAMLALIGLLLALGLWRSENVQMFARYEIGNVALSCVICIAVYFARLRLSFAEWIGPYSYTIYLFHPLFTSASRKALQAFVPDVTSVPVFVVGVLVGLLFPVVLHNLLSHNNLGATLLLGVDYRKLSRKTSGAIATSGEARLLYR
jgi:peptidoglycan/LPS O-acetylase OafA/YrhL